MGEKSPTFLLTNYGINMKTNLIIEAMKTALQEGKATVN
jgi:hypothetical protein